MTKREFMRRLDQAQEFEQKVIAELIARGWQAEGFGQGQLSEEMRDVIRRVNTPVRYMPDIIACKRFPARTLLVFIDAKAGDKWRETGNHDVETAALDAAEKWVALSECPYYFVFPDGGVLEPPALRELGQPGRFRGIGSGTPFLLVPRSACTRFNAIFGPRDQWSEEVA